MATWEVNARQVEWGTMYSEPEAHWQDEALNCHVGAQGNDDSIHFHSHFLFFTARLHARITLIDQTATSLLNTGGLSSQLIDHFLL